MEIIPLPADLMHSEGRTDMAKLTDGFRDVRESSCRGFFRSPWI